MDILETQSKWVVRQKKLRPNNINLVIETEPNHSISHLSKTPHCIQLEDYFPFTIGVILSYECWNVLLLKVVIVFFYLYNSSSHF